MKALRILAFVAAGAVCAPAEDWVVDVTGKARGAPDVYYLLMKMEQQSARASDAALSGEKALMEFLAAVERLKVPGLTWRIANNIVSPGDRGPGMVYSRNIVFTMLAEPSAADRDRAFARLQDLGAKYNSHCVTCIGSG
jgi:hypothetical protein